MGNRVDRQRRWSSDLWLNWASEQAILAPWACTGGSPGHENSGKAPLPGRGGGGGGGVGGGDGLRKSFQEKVMSKIRSEEGVEIT